jgi:hypothetical protein
MGNQTKDRGPLWRLCGSYQQLAMFWLLLPAHLLRIVFTQKMKDHRSYWQVHSLYRHCLIIAHIRNSNALHDMLSVVVIYCLWLVRTALILAVWAVLISKLTLQGKNIGLIKTHIGPIKTHIGRIKTHIGPIKNISVCCYIYHFPLVAVC